MAGFYPRPVRIPVPKKQAVLGKLQAMIVISHFQFFNLKSQIEKSQISNLKWYKVHSVHLHNNYYILHTC